MDDKSPQSADLSCDRCNQLQIQCERDIVGRICASCRKSKKGCYIDSVSMKFLGRQEDKMPPPLVRQAEVRRSPSSAFLPQNSKRKYRHQLRQNRSSSPATFKPRSTPPALSSPNHRASMPSNSRHSISVFKPRPDSTGEAATMLSSEPSTQELSASESRVNFTSSSVETQTASTPPSSTPALSILSSPVPVIDPSLLTTLPQTSPPIDKILCCSQLKPTKNPQRVITLGVENLQAFLKFCSGKYPVRRLNSSIEPIPWAGQDYVIGVVDTNNDEARTHRWFGLREKVAGGVNVVELVEGKKGEFPQVVTRREAEARVDECLVRTEGMDVVCSRHGTWTVFLALWQVMKGLDSDTE